jgi:succinate-semialdehyde dehydrogenase/glutarate-semialdehyde dehydrogenase
VNINEAFAASFASLDAPMGGMRQSGLGRRQGAEGIHRYTDVQTIASQRLVPVASPSFGLKDKTFARLMHAELRLMRKLRRP